MANTGKSINLFLMDGDSSGRIKCSLANWTGIAYKIPRTMLDLCKERADLQQTGVYFLFGKSEETGEDVVYVGQAGLRKNGEGLLGRLIEHTRNSDKDYWTEAVVYTTSNDSFGPTEISYLENRFTAMANDAKRYIVKNGNEPTHGNVTEEKECELEEFIDYAKLVMGTLGHKVFVPKAPADNPSTLINKAKNNEAILFCKSRAAEGKGQVTSEGFIVYSGSKINPTVAPSCPRYIKQLREDWSDKYDDNHSLKEDLLFSSPSAASDFVFGYSSSGMTSWRAAEGITLKELNETIINSDS